MKIQHSAITYSSESFDNPDLGNAGVLLFAAFEDSTKCVAKITYWDASGQYFLEMGESEVPLEVVEIMIAELKQQIPTA